jgi:hypothetical protein
VSVSLVPTHPLFRELIGLRLMPARARNGRRCAVIFKMSQKLLDTGLCGRCDLLVGQAVR